MLNFQLQSQGEAERTIVMDSELDNEQAFAMFVEYIYTSDYDVPVDSEFLATCVIHVQVYVLAKRLCMDTLKKASLHKLSTMLTLDDPWSTRAPMPPGDLTKLIQMVYKGTPDHKRWFETSDEHVETELSNVGNLFIS